MSSFDAFSWIIQEFFPHPTEAETKLIEEQRAYLLSLRSEDERIRFVENWQKEGRAPQNTPQKER